MKKLTFLEFTIIFFVLVLGMVIIFVNDHDGKPVASVRENIDTGKAYIENNVHFIEGGQEVIRVTIKPFDCPHCGREINLMTGEK